MTAVERAAYSSQADCTVLGGRGRDLIDGQGGSTKVYDDCQSAISVNTSNHLPFVDQFLKSPRSMLIKVCETLTFGSTSSDLSLLEAVNHITKHKKRRT